MALLELFQIHARISSSGGIGIGNAGHNLHALDANAAKTYACQFLKVNQLFPAEVPAAGADCKNAQALPYKVVTSLMGSPPATRRRKSSQAHRPPPL